jgi:hypothetical protein
LRKARLRGGSALVLHIVLAFVGCIVWFVGGIVASVFMMLSIA